MGGVGMVTYLGLPYIPNCTHTHTYLTILKLYPQTRFQPSLFVNEWVVCLSLQTHSLPPHSKTGQDRWFPSNHLDRITETGFGDTQIHIYKYMKPLSLRKQDKPPHHWLQVVLTQRAASNPRQGASLDIVATTATAS